MALRAQIVNLVGLAVVNDPRQVGGISQIAVVQDQPAVIDMRVLVKVINPLRVKAGTAALDPVDHVSFRQKQLGQVRTILACNACDQRNFTHH